MSVNNFSLRFLARDYLGILLVLSVVLVLIHLGLYFYHYQVEELPWLLRQLFDLDEENNIPTWYSSFLLANNAFFLLVFSSQKELDRRIYWKLLAIGFLLLSLDEVAGMHETVNTAIETNWAIFGIILIMIVGVFFVPFLLSLPRNLSSLFVISGVVYFSGALIMELIGEDMDADSLTYIITVAIEEGMEMIGAWIFLFALMKEMKSGDSVEVSLQAS